MLVSRTTAGASGPALSNANPAALGAAAPGVGVDASRADHVHPLPAIPAPSNTNPEPLGVADPGVSGEVSRRDHVHPLPPIPALSNNNPEALGVAAPGVSLEAARIDHVHPSVSGPSVTSGTYAARTANPNVGDLYVVTSGVRRGSVYRCEAPGEWTLSTVAVPQIDNCVGLFDGEHLVGRVGSVVRRWNNLAPRGKNFDLTWFQNNTPQPLVAVGATGLFAYNTAGSTTAVRGVLPSPVTSGPRTIAALIAAAPFVGIGNNFAVSWGSQNGNASISLGPRINFDVPTAGWGVSTNGTNVNSIVAGVANVYVVIVATFDGATGRVYREGAEIAVGALTLNGDATDSYFGVMSSAWGDSSTLGQLAFGGAWDAALDAGEVMDLTLLLRERYALGALVP